MKKVKIYEHKSFSYCLFNDIEKVHGAEWMKKFNQEIRGSTCPVVDEETSKNNKHLCDLGACYSWDYERFKNRIDKGIPTYFD